MGGPLFVVFSGCFLNDMVEKLVLPSSPALYVRYVDDTYIRRKKGEKDDLFEALNAFHPNIKLTVEVNPSKFLDSHILKNKDATVNFQVAEKSSKLPFHSSSKVPLQYKKNVILGELHRAKIIGSNFNYEISKIFKKFIRAGYSSEFISNQIEKFMSFKNDFLIPKWMFEDRINVHMKLPFCLKNEKIIRKYLDTVEEFTGFSIKVTYSWITTKARSLFPIKDKLNHHHHVIYKGVCSCKNTYIGETKRNSVIRWKEHESLSGTSEPSKHLASNPTHQFSRMILEKASSNMRKRKISEAYYIRTQRPSLNDQVDVKKLSLFRFGLT